LYPHPRLNGEGHSGPPNQHTSLVLSSFASSKIFSIRSASLPNPITLVFKVENPGPGVLSLRTLDL
jgi:hypothetical protein